MDIQLEEMPTDPKIIRRYLNMRQHFVELTKLPEIAYERDDRMFYKNKFVSALWSMFKAGYKVASQTLKANGHMDLNYHVVGRITKDGHVFADKPRHHTHFGSAVTEMRRLGTKHPGTKFGIFTLVSTYIKEEVSK